MPVEAGSAEHRATGAGIDADVGAGIAEDQQRHQRVILDRRAAECLVQRVGAVIADHVVTTLRHVRTRLGRHDGLVAAGATNRCRAALDRRFLFVGQPVDNRLDLALTVEIHCRAV